MVDVVQKRTERNILNNVYDDSANAIQVRRVYDSFEVITLGTSTSTTYTLTGDGVLNTIYIENLASGETDTLTAKTSDGKVIFSTSNSGIVKLKLMKGAVLEYSYSGVSTPSGDINIVVIY